MNNTPRIGTTLYRLHSRPQPKKDGVGLKSWLWLLSLGLMSLGIALRPNPVAAQNFHPTSSLILAPSAIYPLKTPRSEHTATLLRNGQVLVAGGKDGHRSLVECELYNPSTGTWSETGSLKIARAYHTATLLPNGQVLVTGGRGPLASCELYNPATGTWSETGSMATERSNHTAALLPDGQVLVVGNGINNSPTSCELYNSSTGTWSSTGGLAVARYAHAATLLSNGKVLVSGGSKSVPPYGFLASCELYDPATGLWSATGSMAATRNEHTSTLLNDGQVLVVGGNAYGSPSTCELYDPTSGTWRVTTNLSISRRRHTATLLLDGRVLVAGGDGSRESLISGELYNPSMGTWSATSNMTWGRYEHTATLLPDGQVLLAAGVGDAGYLISCELYNPSTNTFAGSPEKPERGYHTSTLLSDGQVLIAGGLGFSGNLSSCQLYNPATGTFRPTGSMGAGRRHHTATLLPNGQVLVIGGFGLYGYLASGELYDPATGTWSATDSLNNARMNHTATLLPSGQVLVAGGHNGNAFSSCELYDPSTGLWSNTGSLTTGRYDHTTTLLSNGQVLVTGGIAVNQLSSCELFNPSAGTWSPTASMAAQRRNHTATRLKSGQVLVTGGFGDTAIGVLANCELYNPATGLWRVTASMAESRLYHTATLLPNGQVLVTGGDSGFPPISELYDPATGWSLTGSMGTHRRYHTATLLGYGDVLVTGGFLGDSPLASAELYGPAAARLSINSVTSTEGHSGTKAFLFVVTRYGDSSLTTRVNYATANGTSNGTASSAASAGSDYIAASGTLTFAPGETSKTFTVAVAGDTLDEADESFSVVLSGAEAAIILNGQGTGTITNDDRAPSLSINDVTITEGDTGETNASFIVTLSAASGHTVRVSAIPTNGSAKAPGDYTGEGATLTFAPGDTSKTFSVPVKGDFLDEANEVFYVLLSSPVNATISRGRCVATITDDDAAPSISVDNVTVVEGNSGSRYATFALRLSAPGGQGVRVTAQTANGTATAGNDYTALPPTVISFIVGSSVAVASVLVQGDVLDEPHETFFLNLSSPVNATITDNQALASIGDDDAIPSLAINDVSVTEGDSGTKLMTFTVTRTGHSAGTISVNYATASGMAQAGSDYVSKSGTLTFPAGGAAAQSISVAINGDTTVEGNETLVVLLSGATNANIGRARGVGTITNDDNSG